MQTDQQEDNQKLVYKNHLINPISSLHNIHNMQYIGLHIYPTLQLIKTSTVLRYQSHAHCPHDLTEETPILSMLAKPYFWGTFLLIKTFKMPIQILCISFHQLYVEKMPQFDLKCKTRILENLREDPFRSKLGLAATG